jgi:cephalosporin hydroxylase
VNKTPTPNLSPQGGGEKKAGDPVAAFAREVAENIERQGKDAGLQAASRAWLRDSLPSRYSYNFTWLGRPIIQYPQDIVALQEIVWRTRPDLIVETGIAHGGSLVFFASMLALLGGEGRVLGIDVDIRAHNREAIEAHPLAARIDMVEGSSVDAAVAARVAEAAAGKRTMVVLDSNHTHAHVAAELEAYAPLVSKGCYLVVLDTAVEDMPAAASAGRPWGPGNNPKTAVREFVARHGDRFAVDHAIDAKLLISVGPEGYLLCVKEP